MGGCSLIRLFTTIGSFEKKTNLIDVIATLIPLVEESFTGYAKVKIKK